ncbi:MAG: DUF2812 domain-containing protein [Clostridia bacterium]|nr:DUF2812 domain-containing protein [Clostridia bacterium]
MNQTCIKIFSFRPEDYRKTENFLNQMLQKGWRLRWCKGTLAGFVRTENKNLHYIVDPYAVSSIFNLRKFPKSRLNEYMENGWYAIGKSKGCYIFCSDNTNPKIPDLEEGLEESVKKTCFIASLVLAAILTIVLIKLFTTPAILYCILLTDIYIVLTGVIVFLIIYHIINAILLKQSKNRSVYIDSKRYLIHDAMIFIFFILAILLQARNQSSILSYLLLPILVVAIGSIVLITVSKRSKTPQENNKRLIPVICVMGLILFILIPLSVHRLQENSMMNEKKEADQLLTKSYLLPVAHLNDFVSVTGFKNAIKENNSILGNNMIYAEELQDLSIFTNRTKMKSNMLAKPIFNYLFIQTQKEQNEYFKQNSLYGITYYSLENTNIILYQNNNIVYLCTPPAGVSKQQVLELLLSY